MTDEILKEIYELKQSSEYLTKEEAITKYIEEYKIVCEGTEKIYNLIWKQVLESAFIDNARYMYVNIGHSGPLTDLYDLLDHPRYKNYFKLHNNLTKDIWWFSLDEDDKNKIFFVMDDLTKKLESEGFTNIDFSNPLYGARCVMKREKLNEFITLAEEKYSTTETLRRSLQN